MAYIKLENAHEMLDDEYDNRKLALELIENARGKNMKIIDIAKATGLHSDTIAKIYKDKMTPKLSVANKIIIANHDGKFNKQ